jgi:chromosome segregation ATPase
MAEMIKNLETSNLTYQQELSSSSKILSELNQAGQEGANLRNSIKSLNDNIQSYSNFYENELRAASNVAKLHSENFSGLSRFVDSIKTIQEDTEKYHTEMSKLSRNLSALNNMYSGMLNAMNNRY